MLHVLTNLAMILYIWMIGIMQSYSLGFDTVTIIKKKNDENTFIFCFNQDSLHYSKGGMFSVEASAGSKDGVITVKVANN